MCISLPARVLEVDASAATAVCEIGDAKRLVSLAVLTLSDVVVVPGDWLLVNAGLALERIDEAEAHQYESWFGSEGLEDLIGEGS